MALKATIFKAQLQLADMDRGVYADHLLTLARHPSETDERMMLRLFAFAMHVPADGRGGALEFAKGLWDPDEPELWQKDLTGQIVHWIDLGQPDERRLLRACGRADRVTVVGYGQSLPIWWNGIANKLVRARHLTVWQIEPEASAALTLLVQRSMQWQVTIQDGTAWVNQGDRTVEITPRRLHG